MPTFNIRCTNEELSRWNSLYKKDNQKNLASYIRNCINEYELNKTFQTSNLEFESQQQYFENLIKDIVTKAIDDKLEFIITKSINEIIQREKNV